MLSESGHSVTTTLCSGHAVVQKSTPCITPSAVCVSTHMSTPCTAPWVGGSTALPSPPTAAPVGKAPNWLLTDWQGVCPAEESYSDVRWQRRQHCMLTEAIQRCFHPSAPNISTHMWSVDVTAAFFTQHHWQLRVQKEGGAKRSNTGPLAIFVNGLTPSYHSHLKPPHLYVQCHSK